MTCDEIRDLAPAFALGALDADQDRAVREHLATCPEAHDEVAAFAGVVPVIAGTVKEVEPPAALRGRIIAAAAADLEERTRLTAPAGATPADPVTAAAPSGSAASAVTTTAAPLSLEATRAERTARPSMTALVLGLAAVFAIVVLGAWNLSLRSDLAASQAFQQHVDSVLTTAAEPGSTTVILTDQTAPTSAGLAVVGKDRAMSLVVRGFTPTTGSTVYEAWVIAPKRDPVPIGSFTVGSDGTGYMTGGQAPAVTGTMTIALTHEAGPGATTPTLPIVSSGTAG